MTGVFLCWEEANQTGCLVPALGHCFVTSTLHISLNVLPSSSSHYLTSFLVSGYTGRNKSQDPILHYQSCDRLVGIDQYVCYASEIIYFWGKSGSALWMVVPPAILSCGPEETESLCSLVWLKSLVGNANTGVTKRACQSGFVCTAHFRAPSMFRQ